MGGPIHTLQAAKTVVEAASAKTTVSLEATVPLAETSPLLQWGLSVKHTSSISSSLRERGDQRHLCAQPNAQLAEKSNRTAVCENQASPKSLNILFRI